MTVRFRVSYKYEPDGPFPCAVTVELFIPVRESDSKLLCEQVTNANFTVFKDQLSKWWGKISEETGMRVKALSTYHKTWDEASEWANEKIKEAVDVLRKVKQVNEEMRRTMPEPYVIEYEI